MSQPHPTPAHPIRVDSTLKLSPVLARLTLVASLFASVTSCGPAPLTKEPAPLPPLSRAARLELDEYLPAPGLRWLVQAKPRALYSDERLRDEWSVVFSAERLEEFQESSGFEPAQVEELWIAGYALGTVYLFDARLIGKKVEAAFRSRSMTLAEKDTGLVDLTHLTGLIAEEPQALVLLEGHFAAIVEGDVSLAKIIAAYAGRRLKKSPPALGSSFLKPHRNYKPNSPLRVFLAGPFEEATDAVAGSFASGVAAFQHRDGELFLQGEALGLWPKTARLPEKLTNWLGELLDTRELRALGWGFPSVTPKVMCNGHVQLSSKLNAIRCSTHGSWNSSQIANAAHRITSADTEILLSEEAPAGWKSETSSGEIPPPLPLDPHSQSPPGAPIPLK